MYFQAPMQQFDQKLIIMAIIIVVIVIILDVVTKYEQILVNVGNKWLFYREGGG